MAIAGGADATIAEVIDVGGIGTDIATTAGAIRISASTSIESGCSASSALPLP
jgi:hypothetical protein